MSERISNEERQPPVSFDGEKGRQLAKVLAGCSLRGLDKLDQEDIVNIEDLGYGVELTAPGLTVLVPHEAAEFIIGMPDRA